MGLLDSFEDPLGETGEVLSDLGVGGAEDEINEQTRKIQAAIDQFGGLPSPSLRCLFDIDWTKQPTAAFDLEDLVTQGGQVLDNYLAPVAKNFWPMRGIGMLTAAGMTQANVFNDSPPQRPAVWLVDVTVEEGLGELWTAELNLVQPTDGLVGADGTPLGIGQFMQRQSNPDKTQQGITDVVTDAVNYGLSGGASSEPDPMDIVDGMVKDAEEYLWDKVKDPVGDAAALSTVKDPDAIDSLDPRIPSAHTLPILLSPRAPGLEPLLGNTCRFSISRRFPQNKYTLSERWFTGIVTEVQDTWVSPALRSFKIKVEPRLSLLRHRKRYRAFHSSEGKPKNAVQIIQKILAEHGLYKKEEDATDRDEHALRVSPGGFELFGPLAIPGAAVGALDSIATAVGSISGAAGDAIGSVADVLEKDVEDWRPAREYCVQYGETDLAFVQRLLAEEGLTFFFEHTERRETLIIAEDPRIAGTKVLTSARVPLVGFINVPSATATRGYEFAWNLGVSRGLAPSGVTARDRNYTRPYHPTDLKAGSAIDGFPGSLSDVFTLGGLEQLANQAMAAGAELSGGTGLEDYAGDEVQQFTYPAGLAYPPGDDPKGHYDAFDGPAYGEVALQHLRNRGAIMRGKSNCATMLPGHNVRIKGMGFDIMQLDTSRSARMLVTKVRHHARGMGRSVIYDNEFEATHMGLAYRPSPQVLRPRISGVQSATVIDVSALDDHPSCELSHGEDVLFRVRVRFRWDRGTPDVAPYSPWLRFAMPSAGAGTGTLLAPRVGTEVLVAFEDGNPDRPIVVGAVYNGPAHAPTSAKTYQPTRHDKQTPEHSRMDAVTRLVQTGLVSRTFTADTSPKIQDGSYLWFEDGKGRESIVLDTVGELEEKIGEDLVTSVVKNDTHTVAGKQTETVKGDQTLRLRLDKDESDPTNVARAKIVRGDEDVEIGEGDEPDEPDRDDPEDEDVAFPPFGRRDHHVVGDDARTVAGTRTHTIDGFEVLRVVGGEKTGPARALRITGDHTVKIEGDDRFEVWGDRSVKVAKAHDVTAAKVDMKTPASAPLPGEDDENEDDAEGGLTLDEDGAKLTSTGKILVRAQEELTIQSDGDRVLIKAPKKIWLQGASHSIVLDGENERIELIASEGSKVTLASGNMELVVEDGEIRFVAGGQVVARMSVKSGAAEFVMDDGAGLVMIADEEIRMAGGKVDIQPT